MVRWLAVALCLGVAATGCSAPASEPDPSTLVGDSVTASTSAAVASVSTTTTVDVTTTDLVTAPESTSTTALVALPPPFFRYGSFGVIEVKDGHETVLVDEPVNLAWSDGAGGLVFSYDWDSEVEGIWRVPAGARDPIVVEPFSTHYSVINLDGRAAIVRYDDQEHRRCEVGSIGVYDLETGAPHALVVCSGDGDVGWFPSTYGGGLYVGVRWDDHGSCRTISGILFWDRSGTAVDVPTNPYPLSDWEASVPDWIPCELRALLSPDGRLLAYRYRPDSKWNCPDDDEVPYEDWLEESREIPGVVVVLDIKTGEEIFRTRSVAGERLVDFDGRFIVVTTDLRWNVSLDRFDQVEMSTIVDITGSNPDLVADGWVHLIWTSD